jgi:hypothetical protein
LNPSNVRAARPQPVKGRSACACAPAISGGFLCAMKGGAGQFDSDGSGGCGGWEHGVGGGGGGSVPLTPAQPKGEWLCRECVASGLRVMEDVVGKRKPDGCRHGANATGRVQYQIKWQGEAERTWEFRSNIQGRPLGDRTCCCLVDPHVLLVAI